MSLYITDQNGTLYKIAGGAEKNADGVLDSTSLNPVQNRVLYNPVSFAEKERQKSKNSFCIKKGSTVRQNGCTVRYNAEEQSLRIDGTPTDAALLALEPKEIELEKGTYTISLTVLSGTCDVSGGVSRMQIGIAGIESHILEINESCVPTTFRTSGGVIDSIVIQCDPNNVYSSFKFRVQIENGDTATDWQPWAGAILHKEDLDEAVNERELVCTVDGEYTIDITNSELTTLREYFDLFKNDKQKTYVCHREQNTSSSNNNFYNIVGNPFSDGTNLIYFVKLKINGQSNNTYTMFEVIAHGYGKGMAIGYIWYSGLNVYFDGWTVIGG